MILKKLTARFGRLQNKTLELHPGLNVIQLPNEAGKSTWTEFLLAMLYGVDTTERKKAGSVPVKEKFRPWDGGEMSGRIELEADGKQLTIERGSTARAPMSRFRAFETESGLPVSLDGASCGKTLLHCERSVYERSGFIRQQQLTVTQDAALEQKLASLVTTGDEEMAYSHVEQQLRNLKNRVRHNKSGLIPETEQQILETKTQLRQVYREQEEMAENAAQRQALLLQEQALRHGAEVCDALEAEKKQQRAQETEQELHHAEQQLANALAQCRLLPPQEELRSLGIAIDETLRQQRELELKQSLLPEAPQPPLLPQAIKELPRESLQEQVRADRLRCSQLAATPAQAGRSPLLLGLILLLLGVGCLLVRYLLQPEFGQLLLPLLGAGLLLLGFGLLGLFLGKNNKAKKNAAAAKEDMDRLLRSYGAATPDELPLIAERAEAAYSEYDARMGSRQAQVDAIEQEAARLQEATQALLERVDDFGTRTGELSVAKEAVETALRSYTICRESELRAAQLQQTLEARRALVGDLIPISDEDRAQWGGVDPLRLASRLGGVEERLAALQSALDRAGGRLSALGDSLVLEAQLERSTARLSELEEKNAALSLALETLAEANRDLQSRFSPLVCQRAAELFARLTGGRYEKVLLSSDLAVSVQEPGAPETRMLQLLSAGTVDQLYLALRLAISELLLPEAPLVLDDALVAFDDERAKVALEVLQEEAEKRQILLFTCQSREAQFLKT